MSLNDNSMTLYATAKGYLGLPDDAQQAEVERLIGVASSAIEDACGRTFRKAEATEVYEPTGVERLVLRRTPVSAVAEVQLDGSVLDASNYHLEDADRGFLWRDGGWAAADRIAEGTSVEPIPGTSERTVSVKYTAGYVLPKDAPGTPALPPALEQACLETVAEMFYGRGVRHGEESRPQSESAIPPRAESLIATFVRWV